MRCQQEAPVIEKEIWWRFKDRGLRVIALGVKENSSQASAWSYQHGLTYPVIIDPDGGIYKNYGTGSVPYHVLIDRNFFVRLSEENFNKDHLIQILDKHLR
jgi:peroxiredoxin